MIGQTISHYKILEKLGEGGMGVVYKAHDTKLDRLVALKFLPHHLLGIEEEKVRFLREAKAAAVLTHPNICTIYGIEDQDVGHFIAMEFVEGPSLRESINAGPIALPEALKIAQHIAEGLAAAHKKGIVHRDVKPENILLTKEGIPKIADFGLAIPLNMLEDAESGSITGTIGYMSPEQVRGESVDHLTDVWSLGVVLYEMMAGRRPFDSPYHQAMMYAITHEKHRPLSKPGIPRALGMLLDRCLEKTPEKRFPDASSLVEEFRTIRRELKSPHESPLRSIVVMPFADLSPKKDNQYFSDGLTEEITANLSKLRNVKVVSRTSLIRYAGLERSAGQIAGELGVQYALEGSVRKHGINLRITTQLIDASQDVALWAENYSGTMDDVFDIQEKVAARVVRALKIRLTPREKKTLTRRATRNTEAYQLYLKGRFFWSKRTTEGLQKSIRYFEDAIQKDARYAPAWAGLSDAYNLLGEYGNVSRKEVHAKARAAAEKALKIDDQLAEAHTSLASLIMLNEWDWPGAEKEFKLAIRLNPNYGTAHHWYSEWLRFKGRIDDALREISLAVELDPLSPAILKDKGMTYYYARGYDEAIEYAKKSMELEPGFAPGHRLLSLAYQGKGMLAEAIAENERWGALGGNNMDASIGLAQLHAAGGKKQEAERLLESIRPEKLSAGNLMRGVALVYATLGENDRAFEWLEKSYERRSESLCSLKVDPKFDSIRSDPRYLSLLKRIGLGD